MSMKKNNILKIIRTYLHFGPLNRVVIILPVVPGHSSRIVFTIEVQPIQVRGVAIYVPPAAFVIEGTVAIAVHVIITIFGRKEIPSMHTKGITSGTYNNNNQNGIVCHMKHSHVVE